MKFYKDKKVQTQSNILATDPSEDEHLHDYWVYLWICFILKLNYFLNQHKSPIIVTDTSRVYFDTGAESINRLQLDWFTSFFESILNWQQDFTSYADLPM